MAFKWVSVFGVGLLELWAAIPLGFALGLPAAVTGALSAGGSIISAAIVIFLGAKPVKLLIWMTIGIVVWSVILTAAVALGVLHFTR